MACTVLMENCFRKNNYLYNLCDCYLQQKCIVVIIPDSHFAFFYKKIILAIILYEDNKLGN